MNVSVNPVSSLRARLNRLRWWWRRRLGWPGLLALAAGLVSLVLALGVRPVLQQSHVQLLQSYVARLDAADRGRQVTAGAASQRDPRDAARDALPPLSQRGHSVAQLLQILEAGKLAVEGAEYAAEDQDPGLVRLRIALPFHGDYRPTRALVASLLNEMPHAALDAIELERPEAAGESLGGRLRFSLFFRKEAL